MSVIGFVAIDDDGLPIRSGKRGGNHVASAKIYKTASKARGAVRMTRARQVAKIFAVEAKSHITKSDKVIGFALIGVDGRPVRSGPRTRLYTAWGFARRAAKSFGGEVRYVVILAHQLC